MPPMRGRSASIASVPARAINLARQGYVVFAYDMVGYNDTLQTPHDFGDKPTEQLWGFGPLGLQLWNAIRVIDFLEVLDAERTQLEAEDRLAQSRTQAVIAATKIESGQWPQQ